jgi:hypothetical protein
LDRIPDLRAVRADDLEAKIDSSPQRHRAPENLQ